MTMEGMRTAAPSGNSMTTPGPAPAVLCDPFFRVRATEHHDGTDSKRKVCGISVEMADCHWAQVLGVGNGMIEVLYGRHTQ